MAALGLFGAALRRTQPYLHGLEAAMQPFVRLVVGYTGMPFRTEADHSYRRIFASLLFTPSPRYLTAPTCRPFFANARQPASLPCTPMRHDSCDWEACLLHTLNNSVVPTTRSHQ